eukprot:75167_1
MAMLHFMKRFCFVGVGTYCGFKISSSKSVLCESLSNKFEKESKWSNMREKLEFSSLFRADVILSATLAMIPFCIGFISWYQIRMRYKTKYFSDIMNISVNGITKYSNNKYSLYWRTLIENDVNKIILNQMGMKELHKSAISTSKEFTIIKPIKNIDKYKTNCNIISNQIIYYVHHIGCIEIFIIIMKIQLHLRYTFMV